MTEDARALEAAAAGSRAAFEGVVRRHEAAVLRYIRALLDDDDVAEDALQETFIAAWRGAGAFRGDGTARPWLLAIARNAVHRQHRRPVGQPSRFEPLETALEAGWGREPGEAWAARLTAQEVVDEGLRALSPEDREILLLRDLEELGNEETAALLGLSVAAVKSRVHRARLRFMAAARRIHARA